MTSEEQLRARLRRIEALFAGATTPGERLAAEAALARRFMARREMPRSAPSHEGWAPDAAIVRALAVQLTA